MDVAELHFTIAFPVEGLGKNILEAHLQKVKQHAKPIDFVLRRAIVHQTSGNGLWHTYLVPEEGISRLYELHDYMYKGVLQSHLNHAKPYIPVLEVGSDRSKEPMMQLCADLNTEPLAIPGRIGRLALANYDGKQVDAVSVVQLT
jgi:2'-5' RNA ligase